MSKYSPTFSRYWEWGELAKKTSNIAIYPDLKKVKACFWLPHLEIKSQIVSWFIRIVPPDHRLQPTTGVVAEADRS